MRHDEQHLDEITDVLFGQFEHGVLNQQDVDECKAVARAYAESFIDWLPVEDDSQVPGVAGSYLGVVEHSSESNLRCRYVCVLSVVERDSEFVWADLTNGHRVTHYKPYKIEMPK